jgi:hypothetical protein
MNPYNPFSTSLTRNPTPPPTPQKGRWVSQAFNICQILINQPAGRLTPIYFQLREKPCTGKGGNHQGPVIYHSESELS